MLSIRTLATLHKVVVNIIMIAIAYTQCSIYRIFSKKPLVWSPVKFRFLRPEMSKNVSSTGSKTYHCITVRFSNIWICMSQLKYTL